MESVLLDAAGHRGSPATMPGYHQGRPPRNKGEEYPADPPTVEEIIAVMRAVGDRPEGHRLRALINAALARWAADQRSARSSGERSGSLSRCRARAAWQRRQASRGRDGPMGLGAARPVAQDPPRAPDRRGAVRDPRTDSRSPLGSVRSAQAIASRGRCGGCEASLRAAPTPRHAPAEMAHEGVPLVVIQRQLGHANLGITSVYPQGIDSSEIIIIIISTVHGQPRQRSPPTPDSSRGDKSSMRPGRTGVRRPTRHHTPGWRVVRRRPPSGISSAFLSLQAFPVRPNERERSLDRGCAQPWRPCPLRFARAGPPGWSQPGQDSR
jgi:hypothetical protein